MQPNKNLVKEILSPNDIASLVRSVAKEISGFLGPKVDINNPLVLVCVLNGGIHFCSDLARELTIPFEIRFLKASSYSNNNRNKKVTLQLLGAGWETIKNRHVVIVDDIFDSGSTIKTISNKLKAYENKIYSTVVIAKEKYESDSNFDLVPMWSMLTVKKTSLEYNLWYLGYGMDFKGINVSPKQIYVANGTISVEEMFDITESEEELL